MERAGLGQGQAQVLPALEKLLQSRKAREPDWQVQAMNLMAPVESAGPYTMTTSGGGPSISYNASALVGATTTVR